MPLTDPNLGLFYGWQQGESGWHTGMDANLRKLGALVHLAVKSRSTSTPPASPSDGDRYIIPASATGDWAGKTDQIAVRIAGAWEYHVPAVGWVAYIEYEGKQIIYTASGWMLVDDVLGLGTMAQQKADNVNITGGQVNANITGGTFHGVTPTAAGLALLDDADAAAQRATLGLGTMATQDVDNVNIVGGQVSADITGGTFFGVTPTAAGVALLDDADAAAQRATLGLGTLATQDANNVNITGGQINADITGGTFHGITPTQAGLDLLDDANAAAQRATLGLGTAATKDVGTSGNTVPLLNGANTFSGQTTFTNKVGFGLTSVSSAVNRLQIIDTITNSTPYTVHARADIADPSGSTNHSSYYFATVPTSDYGSSGIVINIYSGFNAQNTSAHTITSARNYSAYFTVTNGGTVTSRYGYYDSGIYLQNGSTITNNCAFYASAGNVGATNNFGFYSDISAGAGRWNFYANGTAQNYFKGRTIFATGFARIPTVSTAPDGSTITLTSSTNHLLYNNASPVAALTINLPTSDVTNGQEITIATRSAITTLTINAGSMPVYGAPTTLAAGGFATFIYSSTAGAWFRKG